MLPLHRNRRLCACVFHHGYCPLLNGSRRDGGRQHQSHHIHPPGPRVSSDRRAAHSNPPLEAVFCRSGDISLSLSHSPSLTLSGFIYCSLVFKLPGAKQVLLVDLDRVEQGMTHTRTLARAYSRLQLLREHNPCDCQTCCCIDRKSTRRLCTLWTSHSTRYAGKTARSSEPCRGCLSSSSSSSQQPHRPLQPQQCPLLPHHR